MLFLLPCCVGLIKSSTNLTNCLASAWAKPVCCPSLLFVHWQLQMLKSNGHKQMTDRQADRLAGRQTSFAICQYDWHKSIKAISDKINISAKTTKTCIINSNEKQSIAINQVAGSRQEATASGPKKSVNALGREHGSRSGEHCKLPVLVPETEPETELEPLAPLASNVITYFA